MAVTPSQALATFASQLCFEDIPHNVVRGTEDLFLDWYASAVAGSTAPQVQILKSFVAQMGPAQGKCRIFGSKKTTSPFFAAMVNAAASHVVEQDDLHNQSISHPATVVFPPLFAIAQSDPTISGKEFIAAAVAGYECCIRVGQYLGRSHYRVFHMTATAGTVGAAMAVCNLLKMDEEQTLNALGSAGTQAGGLWEFLKDAADSKQLHTAKASMNGLQAAYIARDGFTGAKQILEGEKGMCAGMLGEGNVSWITNQLGSRWAIIETSFKFHASCRHTHPAADGLLALRNEYGIDHANIVSIKAHVYQAAMDVLGAVKDPTTIHQSKFSMGFVLALIARYGRAGVNDFTDAALDDPINRQLHDRVEMIMDEAIDSAYPEKWSSKVVVALQDGSVYETLIDVPKGDPGNSLSREELAKKAIMLGEYSQVMNKSEMTEVVNSIWKLTEIKSFSDEFI
ncbi:MAG: MmgE/PrpD family protein [Gammaproteobacteria bacterium]|nr:MmgE/PrpD family protein [Gammaproteobacteria bacterium]